AGEPAVGHRDRAAQCENGAALEVEGEVVGQPAAAHRDRAARGEDGPAVGALATAHDAPAQRDVALPGKDGPPAPLGDVVRQHAVDAGGAAAAGVEGAAQRAHATAHDATFEGEVGGRRLDGTAVEHGVPRVAQGQVGERQVDRAE